MRLYEVLVGDDKNTTIRLHKPTDKHYPSTKKFLSIAKKSGDEFVGKIWALHREGKKPPEEIVIRPLKRYQINLFNKEVE